MDPLRAAAQRMAAPRVAQVIAVLEITVLTEKLIARITKRVNQAAAVNSDLWNTGVSRVSRDSLELGADALSDRALILMNLAAFEHIHSEQERADQPRSEDARPAECEITRIQTEFAAEARGDSTDSRP